MPEILFPGTYVEESDVRPIVGVATSVTAFLGGAAEGPTDEAVAVAGFADFTRSFGGLDVRHPMGYAVRDFFDNGGTRAVIARLSPASAGGSLDAAAYAGDRTARTGKYLLDGADLINLVCVLGNARDESVPAAVHPDLLAYCEERRAFLIVDPPAEWRSSDLMADPAARIRALGLTGPAARSAAVFYPRILAPDPQRGGQVDSFPACGAIAGTMARTDAERGVWKPATDTAAALEGATGLVDDLTDDQVAVLDRAAVNAIRSLPAVRPVLWGARTLRGADDPADPFRYVPVRRTALFLEESLRRGLEWVVFEPNDERLWARIRLTVGDFFRNLFRQGAFQGRTPAEAYFVECGAQTTPQHDIDRGLVTVIVGFAPLRPAEFVVLRLQQRAGRRSA
jgi:phage tail sheath protein FI